MPTHTRKSKHPLTHRTNRYTRSLAIASWVVVAAAACSNSQAEGETNPQTESSGGEPDSGTRIAVANRGGETLTLIDVETLETETLDLGTGSEPMYAINPFGSNEIWVGDRGTDRVLVFDAADLSQVAEAPTGEGVFHMWSHFTLGQMWIVCDVDKVMTVVDVETKEVLATAPVPADLADSFKPHDVSSTATDALVTMLDETGGEVGWLVKYSGETFEEIDRVELPGDPHMLYWGFEDSSIYVAAQAGDAVLRLDPDSLEITGELSVPGAHGIWANQAETHLYVGNIESASGAESLYTIDIPSFTIVEGSPVDAALPSPHNFMVSLDNQRLFVSHSAADSTSVSVYDLDEDGLPHTPQVVDSGLVPFGVMLIQAVEGGG